jgi:hypothetical protein
MAELALPPGAAHRRVVFGLLDADGWGWAFVKASFWFFMIIFLLGYIPNLAYYFTVGNTIDVGYNAIPIVNLCDAGNDRPAEGNIPAAKIPCPAPPGTVIPWQANPAELALPAPLTGMLAVQSGSHLYLVGGNSGSGATNQVLVTTVSSDGNFQPWTQGPALPDARTNATLASFGGVPYIIGGLDASGAPTTTTFAGQLANGEITGWVPADGSSATVPKLTLPVAISDAGAAVSQNSLFLVGGKNADGSLSDKVYQSSVTGGVLQPWQEVGALPLPEARAGAAVTVLGNFLYVVGGDGPKGTTNSVFRLSLNNGAPASTANDPNTLLGWAMPVAGGSGNLPEPRSHAASFINNGALYVIGGSDASGAPTTTNYWTVPDATSGDISTWSQTTATDLLTPRTGAAVAAIGSTAFMIGGNDPNGPTTSEERAGLSPKPPFFRLGLFGATIPALSIKGEIGQQLGYINAMTVGIINFVILVAIGIMYSHQRQTWELVSKMSRGRIRPPAEDELQI